MGASDFYMPNCIRFLSLRHRETSKFKLRRDEMPFAPQRLNLSFSLFSRINQIRTPRAPGSTTAAGSGAAQAGAIKAREIGNNCQTPHVTQVTLHDRAPLH
jgi:hypothetical protein